MNQNELPPTPPAHEINGANVVPGSPENVEAVRPRQKFWQRFGGDGFMISLGLHVVLGFIAAIWVVSTIMEEKKEPTDFTTGAGGGNNGANARMQNQRMQPKNARNLVKQTSKLTVKGAKTNVALPDMPKMAMSAFDNAALSGGLSKGAGGGSGGGEGTGTGIGKGGGRNMVSLFGMRGFNAPGLQGVFYDLKQLADGTPTEIAPDSGQQAYIDQLRSFARSGFREGELSKYFKSPERLAATQIFITRRDANSAPAAYGVADKVKPSRWLAYYTGKIKAPKSGRFRLVGRGDDILTVYWNGKPKLDAGYDFISSKTPLHFGTRSGNKPPNNVGNPVTEEEMASWTPGRKLKDNYPLRAGDWIDVTRGQEYKIDILIGETPGGVFDAYLGLEEVSKDNPKKGNGKLLLFKIGDTPLPDEIAGGSNWMRCDMSGGDWIWQPVTRGVGRR